MSRAGRSNINADPVNYINPLDFGSTNDPCFGKLFSLSEKECRVCGDSAFCANQFRLVLQLKVHEEEITGSNMDVLFQDLETEQLIKYIKDKHHRGNNKELIFKMAKKKFKYPSATIRDLITKNT